MVKAIVGANWGDEGKGKLTDMLASQSDIVVRFAMPLLVEPKALPPRRSSS